MDKYIITEKGIDYLNLHNPDSEISGVLITVENMMHRMGYCPSGFIPASDKFIKSLEDDGLIMSELSGKFKSIDKEDRNLIEIDGKRFGFQEYMRKIGR